MEQMREAAVGARSAPRPPGMEYVGVCIGEVVRRCRKLRVWVLRERMGYASLLS